jgi:prepilin peptidase CpaA
MLLITSALCVGAVVAAGWDWQTRRIPNWLTLGMTGLGVALAALPGGLSISGGLQGGLVGLAVGMVAYATGILGAGDGKYLMALGTFFGPIQLLYAILAMAVAGGVLAIVESARKGTLWVAMMRAGSGLKHMVTLGRSGALPERQTAALDYVPYGVAMSAGALFWWFMGGRA